MYLEFFAFLLKKGFFANFLFVNQTIFLLELFTDEPIRKPASVSFVETLAAI